jgi:hypothetical protein
MGDFAVVDHAGEGEAESLAGVARGDPGAFFPAHRVGERITVGAEEDLGGEGFEPLAEPDGEGARGEGERLLREVEEDVGLLQEGAGLSDEGPAAVEEDEVGVAERGVVEEGL